jgi:pimeloyl-ACP methyl ester carboxylesterase
VESLKSFFLAFLLASVSGCSYVGTVVSQAGYSMRQQASPEQRVYKHMLNRETFFVFGRIENARELNAGAIAVIAASDKFRDSEVVDVNHVARPDSYYGLNLPEGDYRLLVVSDLDRNGYYDETDVIGTKALTLTAEAVPDKVLGGYDIDLDARSAIATGLFRVDIPKVAARTESLFYPKGTLRSLDDPIFDPQMATLGMYEPAAFLEAAPMMFYALEEDAGYKVPIVFVHGIGGSARDFESIVAGLDRTRFKPWFYHYPSGTDLHQVAAMFHRIFLSGKVIPLGEMPIVIVAHSMGGLVVREALNLQTGARGENRVQRLITIASPLVGHPGARSSASAPVVIPSWRDLDPDSEFITGLHRKPLPAGVEYHLMFAFGDERSIKLGANSDGVVPLASQLSPSAQKEAAAQHGFDDTHTGILRNAKAIQEIMRTAAEVRPPYPEPYVRELMKGGYRVELGPHYTRMEAFYIRNMGFFMEAIASGMLRPLDSSQEHFLRAARGEVTPAGDVETAWLKFSRDYPDRRAFAPEVAADEAR